MTVSTPVRKKGRAPSNTQANPVEPTVPEDAPCPHCGMLLTLGDDRHAMFECSKLNQLFDPGGQTAAEDFSWTTPYLAKRCAAMSNVDSFEGGTPRKKAPPRRDPDK